MLNVLEHRVIPDGQTLNTVTLQALIDSCGEAAGGTLIFPAGKYLTGGLMLRDNIHLHLEAGAIILGSTNLDDYMLFNPPPVRCTADATGVRALLFAHNVRHIRLSGAGTIDGQGVEIGRKYEKISVGLPRNIWFAECEDIALEGLKLRHSGFWMQHYLKCTKLRIHGIDVFNHGSSNNDGLDIDSCRDVIVSDCTIDCHDDALCLKSSNDWPTENVVITNCITRTHCNHLKTGTESNGGFRNIIASNIQMVPSKVTETDIRTIGGDWRGATGIALGCVDGGMLENISISNVQMDSIRVPFFIKFGDRGRPVSGSQNHQPIQYARDIRLSYITARKASSTGCYLMGLPESPLGNVQIEHCNFEFEGGGDDVLAESAMPLNRDAYPSMDAFGSLPAYGIFMRDACDVQLTNISMHTLTPDARPSLRWQRVKNLCMQNVRESGNIGDLK